MSNPRTPAHQLYYGPLYAQDYFDRNLAHIISSNPHTVATMRKRYGRYLAGFGNEDMSGQVGYDPAYQGRHVYDLEKEDDTFGSGIFDPSGRGGTGNANLGIFAGHYSLPGNVAREVPFTVSKDVTDITDDAAVVTVPGGGMAYVEDQGRLAGAAPPGPTWRPAIQPPGWTRYDQVYVDMQGKPVPMDGFGQLPRRRLHARPPRVPQTVTSVPTDMVSPHGVPMLPAQGPVGYQSIVHAGQVPVGINRAVAPVAPAAPDMPMMPGVPLVSTTNVAMQKLPISGFGAGGGPHGNVFGDEPPASNGPAPNGPVPNGNGPAPVVEPDKPVSAVELAIWGLLAGAGVGIVYSVVSKKGRR